MKHKLWIFAFMMALGAVVALARPAAAQETPQAQDRLTVVELFTSQGCSSCPPADAFLGELTKRADLLPLSLHVDYWDYIGWKDPFADARHTSRQRAYAERFGLRYVYTPQMVIHGNAQATGSDRRQVLSSIEATRSLPHIPVKLQPGSGNGVILVTIEGGGEAAPAPQAADVLLVIIDSEHKTAVKRGENRGRTLSNVNVVRSMTKVAEWTGGKMEFAANIPETPKFQGAGDAVAVFLQSAATGRILGAAKLSLN